MLIVSPSSTPRNASTFKATHLPCQMWTGCSTVAQRCLASPIPLLRSATKMSVLAQSLCCFSPDTFLNRSFNSGKGVVGTVVHQVDHFHSVLVEYPGIESSQTKPAFQNNAKQAMEWGLFITSGGSATVHLIRAHYKQSNEYSRYFHLSVRGLQVGFLRLARPAPPPCHFTHLVHDLPPEISRRAREHRNRRGRLQPDVTS